MCFFPCSNNVLDGMQPTFKQVPPALNFSMTATFYPIAARMADTYPPGPAPITIKSYDSLMNERLLPQEKFYHLL